MKKILLGVLALALVSSTAAYAGGGKKKAKKKKAKIECVQSCCPEKVDCKSTSTCPIIPGCVCK